MDEARIFSRRITFRIAGALFAAFVGMAQGAAAERIALIRDAEIEDTIRTYATPLFNAAGLDPYAVEIHLVNDRRLNAFVAGGMHLFLNTGLLMSTEHPGQVIGVIAHETGHIAGGHLVQAQQALRDASTQTILTYLLGAAAAVVTGLPDVGSAVLSAGSEATRRSFLQYNRAQESAADQAALRFLDRTRQSSTGLLEFLEVLSTQELLSPEQQDPYLRTHPITRDRIEHVRNHVQESEWSKTTLSEDLQGLHHRMQAKLIAFLQPPMRTFTRYKEDDTSIEARYAHAIAHHRLGDVNRALATIDGLIQESPEDPFFHELKGQILFENGRVRKAVDSYEMAVRLLPESALLRLGLAQAMVETNDPTLDEEALSHLAQVVQLNERGPDTWRLLAVVYGRKGDFGLTALSLAEEALVTGDKREARVHAKRALKMLAQGSPGWLRAQDIEREAEEKE